MPFLQNVIKKVPQYKKLSVCTKFYKMSWASTDILFIKILHTYLIFNSEKHFLIIFCSISCTKGILLVKKSETKQKIKVGLKDNEIVQIYSNLY